LGKTCCQETEIYLTVGDIKRITEYVSRGDFYEFRFPADPSYLDQDDDPIWGLQTILNDGRRRVLKQKDGRDCLFLDNKGCQLPMLVRPLVCRLHPFTYTSSGLEEVLDQRCLKAHKNPGENLIDALGMTVIQAHTWHQQLYDEIYILEEIKDNENRHIV